MPLSQDNRLPLPSVIHRTTAFLLLGLMVCAPKARALTVDTLDSLLHEAVHSFSDGDYATAADLFVRIEEEFGHDPVFEDGDFLRRVLPLIGYAELQSGSPDKAAATFERYLGRFDRDTRPNPFVSYNLALAHRRSGNPDQALRQFATYVELFPGRRETALAQLQKAEILFEQDRAADAIERLQKLSESDAPANIRTQGRLLAAQRAIADGRTELAAMLVLEREWDVEAMPEVAVLTFTAMELGDRLMEAENHGQAARSYRLALPRDQLVILQRERMRALKENAPAAAGGIRGARHDFHRHLYERMERQLASLLEADDYTPGLTLRRGQAFLLSHRYRSAWLLFESIAVDDALDTDLRRDAHYRWILAANGLEEWEEALTIARNFTHRYEDSDLAPQAFYLIAQAHSEQRRHPEAVEVLTDLIERFPDHALRQRWHFTRGFSFALLDRFEEARADFESARDAFPEAHLTAGADLWYGLTYFFEQDYATALTEFERLEATYPEHRLTGEIRYRRAATLYAMGALKSALDATRQFIRDFPRHERHGEALVLQGDLHMGLGNLDAAVDAFNRVSPEAGSMFHYAVFQAAKVHRARGDHDQVVSHLRSYLRRDDLGPGARISDALYRMGQAYVKLGRPEEAFPLFFETLDLYGDDREAAAISGILAALEDLHARTRTDASPPSDVEGAVRTLVAADNFNHWLEAERYRARRNDRPTWYARLSLELSERERRAGRGHRADALLLEMARQTSPDKLDPRCLGRAGHYLRENGLAAGERFLRILLEDFPHAAERPYAHYGLARIDYENGAYTDSLRRLRRFLQESPGHKLAAEARLLKASLLHETGDPDAAIAAYTAVLEQREARGRPHARALRGLAEIHRAAGKPEKAIAYFQRIYTLYRAYDTLLAEAYFESALLFEELGDLEAAYNTLDEMRRTPSLEELELYEKAEDHRLRLRAEWAGESDRAGKENFE